MENFIFCAVYHVTILVLILALIYYCHIEFIVALSIKCNAGHCVNRVQTRSFLWSKCRKIRTRKNSVFGHFSCSAFVSQPHKICRYVNTKLKPQRTIFCVAISIDSVFLFTFLSDGKSIESVLIKNLQRLRAQISRFS